jgi:type IX secretion system PorP/SprF family membrane protein
MKIFKRKIIVVASSTLLCITNLCAQDIHFSQFIMTPLMLNPAYAGMSEGDFRGIINYRSQWRSVTSRPMQTMGANIDMKINKNKRDNFFGIGISAYSDKAGSSALQTTLVNFSLAYHLKIDARNRLSAAMQGGINQQSFDPSNLEFDSQFEGTGHNPSLISGETFTNTSLLQPSVSAGLVYSWKEGGTNTVVNNNGSKGKSVNIGLSVHQLNAPNYNFVSNERLGFRYVGSVNSSFRIEGTNISYQPSGFISIQKKAVNAVLGSYLKFTLNESSKITNHIRGYALSFGAHYRVLDALIASCMIETGSLGIGLSYDFNVSSLTPLSKTRGGFEVSIRTLLKNDFGNKNQARFY